MNASVVSRNRESLPLPRSLGFCPLLAMGGALVTPDLHTAGDEEWAALPGRLVTALAPTGITAQTGTMQ
ncbi:MAG TPA: hypothetical protein VEC76_21195 [Streptosporangiaceae bacterium]|nr:hypothetical protein [Streptosporangiaceae bacterium]